MIAGSRTGIVWVTIAHAADKLADQNDSSRLLAGVSSKPGAGKMGDKDNRIGATRSNKAQYRTNHESVKAVFKFF
jgi:hypothetical protein